MTGSQCSTSLFPVCQGDMYEASMFEAVARDEPFHSMEICQSLFTSLHILFTSMLSFSLARSENQSEDSAFTSQENEMNFGLPDFTQA